MTSTSPPVPGRRLILIAILAALAGGLRTLSFAYADHEPAPHGISVAVVAPPAAVAHVAHGLNHAAPGGFDVVALRSASAADAALRAQRIRGALVLRAGGDPHRAQVLTASAAGPSLAQVVQTALSAAARAAGARPAVRDVVGLPARDRTDLSIFVYELGLLIPSVIGSVGIYLIGRRSRVWWRATAALLYAVLVAGFGTLIVDAGFGALTGAWLPLFGIGVLGALAFALPISGAQATLGLPAMAPMALLLIFLGNAISGGSVPTGMLPDVYRQVSPWLPNGAIVHGARSVVYFGGHGVGQPLLALALWAGGGLCLLAVNDALHAYHRRGAPERAAEIYATPGVVHAARVCGRAAPTAAATPRPS
jgi:hypothetical protein